MKAVFVLLLIALSGAAAINLRADGCDGPEGCGDGDDCHPKCQWKCDSPVCNQVCEPICEPPKCSTRCQELGCSKCQIKCTNPQPVCESVCEEPICDWKCHRPSNCPKPKCALVCEKSPHCQEQPPPPADCCPCEGATP